MSHYPALQDFIDKRAGKFRNLKVTYTQGAPPNLFMQDAGGRTLDELSIGGWKAEYIDEYLTEKLLA